MNKAKIVLWACLALAVAVGAGWMWGAWGRWTAESRLRDAENRAELAEARASLNAARVDLSELNFGKAGGDLEQAKRAMSALAGHLDDLGRPDAAGAAREAVQKAGEAQQLSASLDHSASARVADALTALTRAQGAPQK
jgi:hypothetical protein